MLALMKNIKRIPGYVYLTRRQCIWAHRIIQKRREFIRSEYLEEFGAGDYGFDGTQVLIKKIKEQ